MGWNDYNQNRQSGGQNRNSLNKGLFDDPPGRGRYTPGTSGPRVVQNGPIYTGNGQTDIFDTKKVGIIAAIVVLVLGLIVGIIFGVKGFLNSRRLPDCVGMNINDNKFYDVLIKLDKEYIPYDLPVPVFSDTMDLGRIVSQNPKSMNYDDIREKVTFEYSQGIDFVGWMKEDAEQKLKEAGWKAEFSDCCTPDCRVGSVCEQSCDDVKSKTMKLVINQAPFDDAGFHNTGITASVSAPELSLHANSSTNISVQYYGSLPDSCSVETMYSNSGAFRIVNGENNKIEDGSASINYVVVGNQKGQGYARFYLVNSATKEKLAYVDSFIIVEE